MNKRPGLFARSIPSLFFLVFLLGTAAVLQLVNEQRLPLAPASGTPPLPTNTNPLPSATPSPLPSAATADTPTPTLPPTQTPTSSPSATPPLATPGPTIDPSLLPPLTEVILTGADFYSLPYTAELMPAQIYNEPPPVETDITNEVGAYCSQDCAKRMWVSQSGTLLILLVRTNSPTGAQTAADSLSNDFAAMGDESDVCSLEAITQRNREISFADNTFSAVFYNSFAGSATSVLVTSYGSSYMLVLNRHGVTGDLDTLSECLAVQYVGMLQLEKLKEAGYQP